MTGLSGGGRCHPGMPQPRAFGVGLRAADPTSSARILPWDAPWHGDGCLQQCRQTPALPTAVLSLCRESTWQGWGGDGSIQDAGHWGWEPKRFCVPESGADCMGRSPAWPLALPPARSVPPQLLWLAGGSSSWIGRWAASQAHWGQGTTLGKPTGTHTARRSSRLPLRFPPPLLP